MGRLFIQLFWRRWNRGFLLSLAFFLLRLPFLLFFLCSFYYIALLSPSSLLSSLSFFSSIAFDQDVDAGEPWRRLTATAMTRFSFSSTEYLLEISILYWTGRIEEFSQAPTSLLVSAYFWDRDLVLLSV
jgi:hypothetical protein